LLKHPHERWDNLLVLLGEMRSAFREFMVLLRAEERILLGMDRKEIAAIAEKKEQSLGEMCRYEQQVIVVLQQLSGSEGQERIAVWLKKALQPQAAITAKKILQELGGLTQTIQAQGKINEARLCRMQHVVREAINLIYTGLGTGPVYQGSGALHYASVPSSVHLRG